MTKRSARMDQKRVVIYAKGWCSYCWRTKRLLRRKGYAFEVVEVSSNDELPAQPARTTGRTAVPQVFVDGRLVGGFDVIRALDRSGDLDRLVWGEV